MTRKADNQSSIIGPALGGALAQPCESYPSIFPRGTLFDKYPFLLPNLVCTVILICGIVVGILFLEETHDELKHNRDFGREMGQQIIRLFEKKQIQLPISKCGDANIEETTSLLEDDLPPGYSPRQSSPEKVGRPRGSHKAFTKRVVLNIIGYGILAL